MQIRNDWSCRTAEAAMHAWSSPGESRLAQITPRRPRTRCTVGAARGHEEIGDVGIESRHHEVMDDEPHLFDPAPIVDTREGVHELVEGHRQEEGQLEGD